MGEVGWLDIALRFCIVSLPFSILKTKTLASKIALNFCHCVTTIQLMQIITSSSMAPSTATAFVPWLWRDGKRTRSFEAYSVME